MSASFPVVERFVSVNGEGLASGRLAAFIRFAGCDLQCAYCDTAWANAPDVDAEVLAQEEIVSWVRAQDVSAITLTGGEPLLQPGIADLIHALLRVESPHVLRVEVETNGACDLSSLIRLRDDAEERGEPGELHLTVDWKTPSAGDVAMRAMDARRYACLDGRDAVKFVVGSADDVAWAAKRIREAGLEGRVQVLLSPIQGMMEPRDIVACMREMGLHEARLQLQLHKLIWPGAVKGV